LRSGWRFPPAADDVVLDKTEAALDTALDKAAFDKKAYQRVLMRVPTPFVGRSVFLTQLTVARLRAERIIILTGIELGWSFAQHPNQIDRQAAFFQLRHDLFMSQNGFLWVLLHVVERQHASDQTKIGLRLVDARPP
jgi:hypothetical protein